MDFEVDVLEFPLNLGIYYQGDTLSVSVRKVYSQHLHLHCRRNSYEGV